MIPTHTDIKHKNVLLVSTEHHIVTGRAAVSLWEGWGPRGFVATGQPQKNNPQLSNQSIIH